MRLIAADDIGLVKEVDLSSKSSRYISSVSGGDLAVECLCWIDDSSSLLAVARLNGSVDLFRRDSREWTLKRTYELDSTPLRMIMLNSTLLLLSDSHLYSIATLGDQQDSLSKDLPGGPYDVVDFLLHKDGNVSGIIASKGTECPNVISMDPLKITWTGKNASDTPIGLASKFQICALASLSKSIFLATDTTGRLRVYDISVQKKPILELPVFEAFTLTNNYTGTSGMGQTRPIQELAISRDRCVLFMGDTFGTVIGVDVSEIREKVPSSDAKLGTSRHIDFCKRLLRMKCAFKGVMGSVRKIAVTDTTLFVVSAGRYAYGFDLKTKKCEKFFLKQKLTYCIPIASEEESLIENGSTVSDVEDEDEIEAGADDLLQQLAAEDSDEPFVISKSKRRRLRKGTAKNR
jgi:hypothetical protein